MTTAYPYYAKTSRNRSRCLALKPLILQGLKAHSAARLAAHNAYVRYASSDADRKARADAITRYAAQDEMAAQHMRSVMRLVGEIEERRAVSGRSIEKIIQAVSRETNTFIGKSLRDALRKVLRNAEF
jgi:hypothetical protein